MRAQPVIRLLSAALHCCGTSLAPTCSSSAAGPSTSMAAALSPASCSSGSSAACSSSSTVQQVCMEPEHMPLLTCTMHSSASVHKTTAYACLHEQCKFILTLCLYVYSMHRQTAAPPCQPIAPLVQQLLSCNNTSTMSHTRCPPSLLPPPLPLPPPLLLPPPRLLLLPPPCLLPCLMAQRLAQALPCWPGRTQSPPSH